MNHVFLSEEWLDAVLALRAEYTGGDVPPEAQIVMNQIISDVPFGEGRIEISVDTTAGVLDIRRGHHDSADVTVRTDYETAKSVLVDQDSQAVMHAFLSGRILVEGDLTKLMTMQAAALTADPHPRRDELAQKLKALTR